MKKNTNNLSKLFKYYKKYKFLSIMVIILSLGYAGISLLSPIYEGKMLGFFENFNKNQILNTALFLVILRIIIEIVTNLWSRTVLKLNGKVNFDLKSDMLKSLTNFEIKNFDNTNSGLFISRLNKDTTELSELFDYITDDLSGIILNISFIIYVFFLNIYLGFYLILNVILVYILTSKKLFYYKRVKKDYKEKDEKVVGLYTDVVRGIREIKDLNLKSTVLQDVNQKQTETIKAEIKSIDTRRTWNRWIKAFQHILDFIFILISIYFITHKSLEISSFLIIFLYKNKVLDLINYISEIREKLADGKVSSQRVFDIITYESFSKETYGDLDIKNIKGSIEFKNLKFKYGSNNLFNDVRNLYLQEFEQAKNEYNKKQTREDRKIEDYFKKVCESQNDIACEIIIELGDMDFWNDKDQECRLKMIDVYNEQIKDLTKIVPTFKIANATIHFDETSPHMHIVGVPIIENCTRVMKKQVGKSKIFTKTSLTEIQDKMRNACIKSYNKFYEVDTRLKEKQKGRNQDINVKDMSNYKKFKKQLDKNAQKLAEANNQTEKLDNSSKDINSILDKLKPSKLNKNNNLISNEDVEKIKNFTKDVKDITKTVRSVNDLNLAIKDFERTTFETIKEVSSLKYEIELKNNEIGSLKKELSTKDKIISKLQVEKEKIKQELQHPVVDTYNLIVSVLYYLLVIINRAYAQTYRLPVEVPKNNYAFKFKDLLEKHIRTTQRVQEYADMLRVSRITLNNSVMAQFGVSAIHLLKQRLLEELKNELLFSNLNVSQLADEFHFSDPSHLMRFFKKETGKTFTQYLMNYKRGIYE